MTFLKPFIHLDIKRQRNALNFKQRNNNTIYISIFHVKFKINLPKEFEDITKI